MEQPLDTCCPQVLLQLTSCRELREDTTCNGRGKCECDTYTTVTTVTATPPAE